ncbi:MAG TPA: hemolysin III family protein [Kofleriaceae bacterium]|nr:hemolysin III family protein [Kofleriaceae bacterium]
MDKPTYRGVSHQFAFFVALGAGAALIATARTPWPLAIYVLGLAAMFGASATYHRLARSPAARRVWRRVDHSMIFVAIAATYTPICAIALRGPSGTRLAMLVWGGAALGIARAIAWTRAPRAITAALYVALGWALIAYLPEVRAALPLSAAILIAIGGLLYTCGAIVYALRRPDPRPAVFGYHEVFHAFVVAAAACHFAAIVVIAR